MLRGPLVVLASIAISACAHQSKVPPSEGHIGSKTDVVTAQQPVKQSAVQAPIPRPVRSSPVLPPPKPTKKAQTYSVVVNEVPVKEILFALARESNINVDIHPSIQGRATLNAVNQTLPAILERLSRQVDLTYQMKNNVLVITPDQPVLRTYKIDYVNINRDTEGFIGSATEISSTGGAASTDGSTQSNSSNANNSSSTAVTTKTENHLWESLVQNIKELLAETDKEVIVKRYGTLDSQDASNLDVSNEELDTQSEQLDEQRTEYQTLLAANVIANPETGVISVRATNKQHQKVQEFIDQVMGSAKKQVLVEATIVEVTLNDGFKAGIDWNRLGNSGSSSGFTFSQGLNLENQNANINGTTFSRGDLNTRATGEGIVVGYFNPLSSLGNIAASVNLLKQFGDTKVLSSPKLMVLNNQTAVLKVVDNIVYFTVESQQSTVGGTVGGILSTVTTTPNTVAVGMVMSVTPQINDSGNVNINVRPTISSITGFKQDPNPNLTNIDSFIPEIRVREMESVLRINSGNTAVLGGLMQDEIKKNSDSVPGLSEVPGVGNVFKGRDESNKKTELVIFLRPTVIPNADLESDELSSFKQYLPAQQLQKALDEAN